MESELIKQWNPRRGPRLGVFGLLRESLKTIKRNGKLMFPLLLLVFVQISLLEPLGKDVASQHAQHAKLLLDFGKITIGIKQNIVMHPEVFLVKLFISTFSSITFVVLIIAIVSSSYEAYTAKAQNLTEMIMTIKKSLRNPIDTYYYMMFAGAMFVSLLSVWMVSIWDGDSSWVSMLYGVVFLSIIAVLWIYVGALWMMSMVVSVLEEVGGVDAIIKGRELLQGEKVKASVLVVLYYVAYGLVQWMMNSIISLNMEKLSGLVISIALTKGLLCGLKLFGFVVFTIFYHEQKESCDDKADTILYLLVVGDEV